MEREYLLSLSFFCSRVNSQFVSQDKYSQWLFVENQMFHVCAAFAICFRNRADALTVYESYKSPISSEDVDSTQTAGDKLSVQ